MCPYGAARAPGRGASGRPAPPLGAFPRPCGAVPGHDHPGQGARGRKPAPRLDQVQSTATAPGASVLPGAQPFSGVGQPAGGHTSTITAHTGDSIRPIRSQRSRGLRHCGVPQACRGVESRRCASFRRSVSAVVSTTYLGVEGAVCRDAAARRSPGPQSDGPGADEWGHVVSGALRGAGTTRLLGAIVHGRDRVSAVWMSCQR